MFELEGMLNYFGDLWRVYSISMTAYVCDDFEFRISRMGWEPDSGALLPFFWPSSIPKSKRNVGPMCLGYSLVSRKCQGQILQFEDNFLIFCYSPIHQVGCVLLFPTIKTGYPTDPSAFPQNFRIAWGNEGIKVPDFQDDGGNLSVSWTWRQGIFYVELRRSRCRCEKFLSETSSNISVSENWEQHVIQTFPKDPCMEYLPTLGLF